MKYHVNQKTGRAGQCRATKKGCPLGSDTPHFDSKAEAQAFIAKDAAETNEIFNSLNKSKEAASRKKVIEPTAVFTPKKITLPESINIRTDLNTVIGGGRYMDEEVTYHFDRDSRTISIMNMNGETMEEFHTGMDGDWALSANVMEAFEDGSREWGKFDNGEVEVKFNTHFNPTRDAMLLNIYEVNQSNKGESDYSNYKKYLNNVRGSEAKELLHNAINNTDNFVIDENPEAREYDTDNYIYHEIHPDYVREEELTRDVVTSLIRKSGDESIKNDKDAYDNLTHDVIEFLSEHDYYNRKYYDVVRDGEDNAVGMEFIGEGDDYMIDDFLKITEGEHEKTGRGVPVWGVVSNHPNGRYFELD